MIAAVSFLAIFGAGSYGAFVIVSEVRRNFDAMVRASDPTVIRKSTKIDGGRHG